MLDPIDEMVLKGIYDGKSIQEISDRTNRALAAVHLRLRNLEKKGYISPPPAPHMARSRTVTNAGEAYLVGCGYINLTSRIFDTKR